MGETYYSVVTCEKGKEYRVYDLGAVTQNAIQANSSGQARSIAEAHGLTVQRNCSIYTVNPHGPRIDNVISDGDLI